MTMLSSPKALAQKHQIAFYGIEGVLSEDQTTQRSIKTLVESIEGLDTSSVRLSVGSASLSLSFNPARITAAKLEKTLTRKLPTKKISLFPLRLMKKPGEFSELTKL